jgi:hypothetical protein
VLSRNQTSRREITYLREGKRKQLSVDTVGTAERSQLAGIADEHGIGTDGNGKADWKGGGLDACTHEKKGKGGKVERGKERERERERGKIKSVNTNAHARQNQAHSIPFHAVASHAMANTAIEARRPRTQ